MAIAYALLILLLDAWPFTLHSALGIAANKAEVVSGKGLVLDGPGLARSSVLPDEVFERLREAEALTLLVRIEIAVEDQQGPARIVSYSADSSARNFTLGQAGEDLVLRLRTTATDANGRNPDTVFSGGLHGMIGNGGPVDLAVVHDGERLWLYRDGMLLARAAAPPGDFSTWDPTYRLVLGNERYGERPWLGKISRLAIFDRSLGPGEILQASRNRQSPSGAVMRFDLYSEDEPLRERGGTFELSIPGLYPRLFQFRWLVPEPRRPLDILQNLMLMLPFGWLAARSVGESGSNGAARWTLPLLMVCLLAFAGETLQAWVAARTSSLADLASAISGGVIGVALAQRPGFRPR